jgi:hypothetical protein
MLFILCFFTVGAMLFILCFFTVGAMLFLSEKF